jgi:hypothetical protein
MVDFFWRIFSGGFFLEDFFWGIFAEKIAPARF